jgi:membrane-associated phospholipid phosphatase
MIKSSYNRHFRRTLWLIVILATLAMYFPINRFIQGGVQLRLSIDRYIPLYPPFIIPYLLGSLSFIGLPAWAAVKAKSGQFESYAISILLASVVSYVVYIAFPTFVTRPEITSSDMFSSAIALLYQNDRAYDAAPSGHTFYTTVSVLFLVKWIPRYTAAWALFGACIIASTLFTRQHNVLDLVCGLALGILAYLAGRYLQKKWNLKFAS